MSFREEILVLAGETKSTMAARTRRALDVIDDAMVAKKPWRSTHQGVVVEEREDIDTRARIEGADRALDLVGARVSKSATTQGPSGPTQVIVVIPRAPEPQHAQAEVIEVAPASS